MPTPAVTRRTRFARLGSFGLVLLVLVAVTLVPNLGMWNVSQGDVPRSTTATITTFTWRVTPPATGVRVIAVGFPRIDWPPVQESWLPITDAGQAAAPMLGIVSGCGVAEELHWPAGANIVQPQRVHVMWLGCW